jgi:hypothetical protein
VAEAPRPGGFSLRRWSQRKLAAAQRDEPARSAHRVPDEPAAKADPARSIAPLASTNPEHADVRDHPMHVASGAAGTSAMASAPAAGATGKAVALPPLESLTIDSDFSPFMQAGVDEDLKRNALRKLLRDPQFNVMDGLDVYIDDYSKPSPLEPELARTLMQARYIFDAPKTRVTAEGIVEDVPQGDDAGATGAPAAAEGTQSSAPAAIRAGANAALPGDSATAEAGTAPFAAAADPAAASAPSAPSTPASNR